MAKPPHISDERGILPDFRGTGFTRKIQVHDPMHAALDINIPNYARAMVTTNAVVDALAAVHT